MKPFEAGAVIASLAICACVLFIPACGESSDDRASAGPGLDVILITLDTTRADHLGCYGRLRGELSPTPALDALARDGRAFSRAQASTPLTLPSHATMLTGLEPPQHGVRENNDFRLAARSERRFATISERLRDLGMHTAGFVSARVLARDFGLDAGFDHWDEVEAGGGGQLHFDERDAVATTDRVLEHLDGLGSEKIFLWVHYFDPHHPHEQHGGRAGEAARIFGSAYDGEISHMDGQIARLVAALKEAGRYDDALILCVGDHGEGLGDHGEETHGFLLHQATMRVPFIVKPPRGLSLPADLPVATADVAPTIAALVGVEFDGPALAGRDVFSLEDEPRPLYGETVHPFRQFGWDALFSLILGDLKVVVGGGRRELFDLAADPVEAVDLAMGRPEDAARMERLLRAHRQEMGARELYLAADPRVAELNGLRANGYAGGPSKDVPEEPQPDAALAHPADKLETVSLLDELTRAVDRLRALQGDARQRELYVRAEEIVRILASRDGDSPAVLFWIGRASLLLAQSGSAAELGETVRRRLLDRALEDLAAYGRLRPLDHRALNMRHLAHLELAGSDVGKEPLETIVREFRVQEARGLADGLAHALCGRALEGLGRKPEALERFSRAAELAPERRSFALDRDRLARELEKGD